MTDERILESIKAQIVDLEAEKALHATGRSTTTNPQSLAAFGLSESAALWRQALASETGTVAELLVGRHSGRGESSRL